MFTFPVGERLKLGRSIWACACGSSFARYQEVNTKEGLVINKRCLGCTRWITETHPRRSQESTPQKEGITYYG